MDMIEVGEKEKEVKVLYLLIKEEKLTIDIPVEFYWKIKSRENISTRYSFLTKYLLENENGKRLYMMVRTGTEQWK